MSNNTRVGILKLALFDVRVIHHIPLAAVAVKAFSLTRIIDYVLSESLTDHEAYQRLRAIVHRLMRRAARGTSDEVTRTDLVLFIADHFSAVAGQNINRFVLVLVRVKLRRFVARRDRH